jgi:HlyD family secretion protein
MRSLAAPANGALIPAPSDILTLPERRLSVSRYNRAGMIVVAVLAFGFGGSAALVKINGAVIAQGRLVVQSHVKQVEHPTGGVVGELLVKDGDRVHAGDLLIRLDATQVRSNLEIVRKNLDQLMAEEARLEAERDGDTKIDFDPDLLARAADPTVAKALAGETKTFELRHASNTGQKTELQERIIQLQDQIAGYTAQLAATDQEHELLQAELVALRPLYKDKLVDIQRMTSLEDSQVKNIGDRGNLIGEIAATRGKMAETQEEIIDVDAKFQAEVASQLSDARTKIAELSEKKVAAEDQLARIDIRSPQDGVVQQLEVHTIGGVVPPRDPLMLIVPTDDNLVVEAHITPQDIADVQVGSKVVVHLASFSARTTPELNGTVSEMDADVQVDTKNNTSFYTMRVTIPPEEIARLGDRKLVAGMPVEAFIQTGKRTILAYLMKPMRDQLNRALREK